MKLDHFSCFFGWVNGQFVVISSRGNVVSFRTPLQSTDFLVVSFVVVDKPITDVPSGDSAIPRATCKKAWVPGETADSAWMPIKLCDFGFLNQVEDFDLSKSVANGQFVLVTERYWAQVVIHLAGLIDLVLLWRTSRPHISCRVQSHCYLVVVGPVQQVQVEIILEVGGTDDLEGFLADLPDLDLIGLWLLQRLTDILLVGLGVHLVLSALAKTHDLVGEVGVLVLEDILLEHFLIGAPSYFLLGKVAFHLEGSRTDLGRDETIPQSPTGMDLRVCLHKADFIIKMF